MHTEIDLEALLERAAEGSVEARGRLLSLHRERLRLMVKARLDPRLSARVDSSDVLQDVMAEAARGLDDYLQERPADFYVWIRGIAERRLIDLHRRHLHAAKRSVRREADEKFRAAGESMSPPLVEQVSVSQSTPSQQLIRLEERAALFAALELVSDDDRELLVLRYVEQKPLAEVAAILGITLAAVKSRHLRAVARLTTMVKTIQGESS